MYRLSVPPGIHASAQLPPLERWNLCLPLTNRCSRDDEMYMFLFTWSYSTLLARVSLSPSLALKKQAAGNPTVTQKWILPTVWVRELRNGPFPSQSSDENPALANTLVAAFWDPKDSAKGLSINFCPNWMLRRLTYLSTNPKSQRHCHLGSCPWCYLKSEARHVSRL